MTREKTEQEVKVVKDFIAKTLKEKGKLNFHSQYKSYKSILVPVRRKEIEGELVFTDGITVQFEMGKAVVRDQRTAELLICGKYYTKDYTCVEYEQFIQDGGVVSDKGKSADAKDEETSSSEETAEEVVSDAPKATPQKKSSKKK